MFENLKYTSVGFDEVILTMSFCKYVPSRAI